MDFSWNEIGKRLQMILSVVDRDDTDWVGAAKQYDELMPGVPGSHLEKYSQGEPLPESNKDQETLRSLLYKVGSAVKNREKQAAVYYIGHALAEIENLKRLGKAMSE